MKNSPESAVTLCGVFYRIYFWFYGQSKKKKKKTT